MTAVAIQKQSDTRSPLGRTDWLKAALGLLIEEGIDAVQITRLAKSINVSRGSFYWHFDSRGDLLQSMLEEWQTTNNRFFGSLLSECETLDEGILTFFGIWVDGNRFSPELDQAVRDWARLDKDTLSVVRNEDSQRLTDIADMFRQFGYSNDEANVRARVLYFSQVGYTAMNLGEAMSERLALLQDYYYAFTGRTLDQTIAARFIEKMRWHS